MPQLITVLYNREDASEVVAVQVRDFSTAKDLLKKGQGIKTVIDFARRGDPTQIVFKYTQIDAYQRDILKSTKLTDEQKAKYVGLLERAEFWDQTAFGIGDSPPSPIQKGGDVAPPAKPLIVIFFDP